MKLLLLLLSLAAFQYFAASAEFGRPENFSFHLFAPQLLTSALLAVVLVWYCSSAADTRKSSAVKELLLFFVIAIGVHFRREVFFYWDEWLVLERYKNMGAGGVIYTHNEHFLPIFFYFYFLLAKFFGIHYLRYVVVGLFFHALNACLLRTFICRLIPQTTVAQRAGLVLACFYLVNAAHAEVLHWAFELSVVICQTVILWSMICLFDYFRTGDRSKLFHIAIGILVTPFIFGGGFTLPAILMGLTILAPSISFSKQNLLRAVPLVNVLIGAAVCAGIFYFHFRELTPVAETKFVFNRNTLEALWHYILVGAELGAILRGLGLFPSLGLEGPRELYERSHGPTVDPELHYAWAGFWVSVVIVVVSLLCSKDRRATIKLWLLGQLLMLLTFLLPALVRVKIGIFQSLALRYQYGALIGLCVMLTPLAVAWYEEDEGRMRLIFRSVLGVAATCSIAVQLFLGSSFTYFTNVGRTNRAYIAELTKWRVSLATPPDITANNLFEQIAAGKYPPPPIAPPVLSPAFDTRRAYTVLGFLAPQTFEPK